MRSLLQWFKWVPVEERIILVCAGSSPGRVPFAMASRASARRHSRRGVGLRFSSRSDGILWSFYLISDSETAAEALSQSLQKRSLFSIYPGDGIRTVVISRSDKGEDPFWIGGDITMTDVDPSKYELKGNNVYFRKTA